MYGLPSIIKVGYQDYTTILDTAEGIRRRHSGETDFDKFTITVSAHVSKVELADTLIHEVLHAIFHSQGLNTPDEENLVTNLAHGLVDVFRRNPGLVFYLLSLLNLIKERSPQVNDEGKTNPSPTINAE